MFQLFIAFSFIFFSVFTAEWTYQNQENWPSFSKVCGGNQQSPIDIIPSEVIENYTLNLKLINYNERLFDYTAKNNGHSVQFTYTGNIESRNPYLTGSVVNYDIYRLAQFHFHWGTNKYEGSEHTINGYYYPYETHFVHYNVKYPNFEAALGKPDGVVVMAVFHQFKKNRKMSEIVLMVDRISDTNETFNVYFPIKLLNLMPFNTKKFYTYQGSLTTPPCTESVTWIVLDHFSYIDKKQIQTFRNVISNNFRDLQYIGKRIVQSSFNPNDALLPS